MRNYLWILLVALLIAAALLCASCGKKPEKTEGKPSEPPTDKTAGIANPMQESGVAALRKQFGCPLSLPENAGEQKSFMIGGKLGELRFTLDGVRYTARMQKTAAVEDITGLYYQWTDVRDLTVCGSPAVCYTYDGNEKVTALLWYEDGLTRSLSCEGLASPEALGAIAESVFGK